MVKSGPRITVRGHNRAYRNLVRNAARWMVCDLMNHRLSDTLTIRIKLVKDLLKSECIYGDCEWTDDNRRPKEFTVRLYAGLSRKRTLKTLAHELIHVKQFARRELYDHIMNADLVTWKGQRVDSQQVSYEDHPWEKEAYEMEKPLLNRWAQATGNDKYLWRSNR